MNPSTKFTPVQAPSLIAMLALGYFSVLIAGCQPTLSFEKQYSLTPAEIMTLPIDPIGVEQTIAVTATAADDAQFSVHVYLAKNEDAAEAAITTNAATDLILASATNTATANLSAKIPANEEAVVRLSAQGDSATINVAINN